MANEEKMLRKRCFVAIPLSEKMKEFVFKIQEKLPNFVGKKIEGDNLHLTLKFLGELTTEEIEVVKNVLSSIKFNRIKLKVNGVCVFSRKFIRIIGLCLDGLDELQKKVDVEISSAFERFALEKNFVGHLTIARVKKILEDKSKFLEKIDVINVPKVSFEVNAFYLMSSDLRSDGPKYNVLAEFKLD